MGLHSWSFSIRITEFTPPLREEDLASFHEHARLAPCLPNIRENHAKALLLLGRETEAATHFAAAAELRAAR